MVTIEQGSLTLQVQYSFVAGQKQGVAIATGEELNARVGLSLIGLEIQWQLAGVFRKSHSVPLARRWRQRRYMAGNILLACPGDRGPAHIRCASAPGTAGPQDKTKDDDET